MATTGGIRDGMQVLGSDGGAIGTVMALDGDRITVRTGADRGGSPHHVPAAWVSRIDDHVHLDRPAADVWRVESAAAYENRPQAGHGQEAPVRKANWLPWIVLAILVLIAAYVLIRGFDYSAREPNYEQNANGTMNSPDV